MSTETSRHPHELPPPTDAAGEPVWLFAAAGLCASLVGLGLARFAYTPLIPALIAARWFNPTDAVYLGAANLAGYLAGALVARGLGARAGAVNTLRVMMVLATACFFACSMPQPFYAFFVWRFVAGLTGGVIMVLAASTILPRIAPRKRGVVGGVIFVGVGLGIAASGSIVPLLLQLGLKQTWVGLGLLSASLTLASWRAWPAEAAAARSVSHGCPPSGGARPDIVRALAIAYGLNALALVPHMVFLVDFVARGLGQGIAAGSNYWALYGIGALMGPLVIGHLADRSGFGHALRVAFAVEAVAVLLPALSVAPPVLIGSSIVVGGFTPGIVPLVLGRIHELVPGQRDQQAAWAGATTMFALFQAAGAYALSYLFARTGGDYRVLFTIGAAAVAGSLAIERIGALMARRHL